MFHADQNPNAAAATEDMFCEAREATLSYLIAVLVLLLVFLCFVLGFCAYQTRQGARRQRKRRRKTCRRHHACHYCKSEEGRNSRSSACLRLGGEDGSPVSLLVRRGSTSSAGWASPFHPRFNSPASSSSSSLQPSVLGTELLHPEPATRAISSMAGRPLKTVNRIIQAYRDDERRIQDAPHPRRPRATTAGEDHHIVAVISMDPFQSARHLKEALDLDVSEMMIRRWLAEAGFRSRMSAQKHLLTETNKAQRGRIMVNVWGALSKDALGPLFRIEGSLTSQIYCEVIDYAMLPYVLDGPFLYGAFTFQQDLPPVHTSGMVRRLLEESCAAMARRLLHRATADELWCFVLEEWEKLQNERNFVSALFSSLPFGMRAVVDAGRNRRVTLATVHGPETSDQSRVSSLEWDNFHTCVATPGELLFPDLCSTTRQDTEGRGGSSESCTTVVLLDTREHWL
ncbi:hypothetical protein HPB47_018860 [Ixodes persulcatus]|uniref:Uncharacterized protein n=1 Tax=Ixodes persulcatus TaxID=34615 RepID=A0AC60R1J7_IXOPE|nr:hypothetical protein HPB47_018860 [Ixodes persulcatus]